MEFEYLLGQILEKHLNHSDGSTPLPLAEAIRYSLLAPGKRIRPRLLFALSEMVKLPHETAIYPAVALEMAHCFTLIHDDLPCMDNDDFRRGLPSNHKKFGEGTALLAGDALATLAFGVFLDTPVSSDLLKQGLKRLSWALGPCGVIGGQAGEELLTKSSTLADLKQVHRQKTGALFTAALMIPKDLVGISDNSHEGIAIRDFADSLGLGFQLADDLEDAKEAQLSISKNSYSVKNILSFLTPFEACQSLVHELNERSLALGKIWGAQAYPVQKLAQEVILKAENAAQKLA